MGVSTDGIVAFGFDLGEDAPESLQDEEGGHDWHEFVAKAVGLERPGHTDYKRDWPQFWKAKDKAVEAFPVELVQHCSGECPMYFLAITGTVQSARRGYPERLKPQLVTDKQIEAMRKFCKEYGVEWKEPDWHVFSYWG